jgi:hypothetical protein
MRDYADIGLEAITAGHVTGSPGVGTGSVATGLSSRDWDAIHQGQLIADNVDNLNKDVDRTVSWRASPVTQDELDEAKSLGGGMFAFKYDTLKDLKELQAGKSKAALKAEEAFSDGWRAWKKGWDSYYDSGPATWQMSLTKSPSAADYGRLNTYDDETKSWVQKYSELTGHSTTAPMPTYKDVKAAAPKNAPVPTPPWVVWLAGGTIAVSLAVIVVKILPTFAPPAPVPPPLVPVHP